MTNFRDTWIREWYQKGVRMLNDLLKSDGSLMNYEEFKNTYKIHVTFLDYYSLEQSLPEEWREAARRRELEEPLIDPVICYVVSKAKGAAHLTHKLIESKAKQFENIWEKAWESKLSAVDWEQIYTSLTNTSLQYREIRYKIIARTVGTNSLLKYMKLRTTDACDYCGHRENIEHKFWYCRRVKVFWTEIKSWLVNNNLTCAANKVTAKTAILGGHDSIIVNHFISVAIYMIYTKRHFTINLFTTILSSDLQSEIQCKIKWK